MEAQYRTRFIVKKSFRHASKIGAENEDGHVLIQD